MDDIFTKKIEDLYKKKQFEQIKFEIGNLEEKDKKNPFIYNLQGIIEIINKNFDQAKLYFQSLPNWVMTGFSTSWAVAPG